MVPLLRCLLCLCGFLIGTGGLAEATESTASADKMTTHCEHTDPNQPNLYLWNPENLNITRTRLANTPSSSVSKAYERLLRNAEKALISGPFSVVFKTKTPPSGNKQDYYSTAPYWWPNPATKDGLPYIRKDGVTNPDRKNSDTDRESLGQLSNNVVTLSLAAYLSGEVRYAQKAAALLRVWFVDELTSMNPNLNYAQAIPGVTDGRGVGIIDTYSLVQVIDAIGLLEHMTALSAGEIAGLKGWFTDYTLWLITSSNGMDERKRSNNHGIYYDLQVAVFAAFVGDYTAVKVMLDSIKNRRIPSQINAKGQLPAELKRTKSFHYTAFTIRGLMDAADLAECIGEDLWMHTTPKGAGLQAAIDFQATYAGKLDAWKFKRTGTIKTEHLFTNLLRAADAYKTDSYRQKALVYQRTHSSSLAWLLYPEY